MPLPNPQKESVDDSHLPGSVSMNTGAGSATPTTSVSSMTGTSMYAQWLQTQAQPKAELMSSDEIDKAIEEKR